MHKTFGFHTAPFGKDLDPQALFTAPAYQEALAALGDGAERDIRIVEGV